MTAFMKTYHGSCHCAAVRFEAEIDFSLETVRCNCTICLKRRYWAAIVKPESFRLLIGSADLTEYRFNTGNDQHFFCKHCGVPTFGLGNSPRWGKFYNVNVTCLDDVSETELSNAPIRYLDGRHDNWQIPLAVTDYL
jgi:hypothetical protein